MTSWTSRCLQVALNLSLNSLLFHSQFLPLYSFQLNWTDAYIYVSSFIHLMLSSLTDLTLLWQWTKSLPGDTCQAHSSVCNNSSIGSDKNNSEGHILTDYGLLSLGVGCCLSVNDGSTVTSKETSKHKLSSHHLVFSVTVVFETKNRTVVIWTCGVVETLFMCMRPLFQELSAFGK